MTRLETMSGRPLPHSHYVNSLAHAEAYRFSSVNTLEQQLDRAYDQYKSRESDLRKNSFLQSLKGASIHRPLEHD